MRDGGLLLALAAFSTWCFSRQCLEAHALFHDNHKFYGLFRDQMHAANAFGEFALWFPHYQSGYPGYYYNFLGDLNCSCPLFVLNQLVFWILGAFGYSVHDYFYAYLLYFAVEVPVLYLIATYVLARQLFRARVAVAYTCVVSAFSPGVLLNYTDIGFLEPVVYSLLFLSSFIAWFREPTRIRLMLLGLASAVLGTSLNYTFIIWNVVFLPLALGSFVLCNKHCVQRMVSLARRNAPALCMIGATTVACALPNVVVYAQGKDIVRSKVTGTTYGLEQMAVGNPLEALLASVPGVVVNWKKDVFQPLRPTSGLSGFVYLGLVAWPLAVVAIMGGPKRIRLAILAGLVLAFGVVVLCSGSPFWAAAMGILAPLRANNHFSDGTYRAGGYLIILYAAAFGLQRLANTPARWLDVLLLAGVSATAAASVAVYAVIAGSDVLAYPTLGLMLLLAGVFAALTAWLPVYPRQRALTIGLIVATTFLDVATVSYLHVKSTFTGALVPVKDTLLASKVGFESQPDEYANHLMCYRSFLEIAKKGVDLRQLRPFAVFQRAHAEDSLDKEIATFVSAVQNNRVASLCIDEQSSRLPDFRDFTTGDATGPIEVDIDLEHATYNTFRLRVQAPRNALLYLNDAYSPYWSATLDGQPLHIARALIRGKAVVVPAGRHTMSFVFRPPWVHAALTLSYSVLAAYVVLLAWAARTRRSPMPIEGAS